MLRQTIENKFQDPSGDEAPSAPAGVALTVRIDPTAGDGAPDTDDQLIPPSGCIGTVGFGQGERRNRVAHDGVVPLRLLPAPLAIACFADLSSFHLLETKEPGLAIVGWTLLALVIVTMASCASHLPLSDLRERTSIRRPRIRVTTG